MDAFFISAGLVALAELGDKTQLLALALTARYRQPRAILAGMAVATLANHTLAGLVGRWLSDWTSPDTLRWGVGLLFIALGAWTLLPDKLDDANASDKTPPHGAFVATLISFFLVEMGDKTQVATVALAARYPSLLAVALGSTAGLLLANAPVVCLGQRFADRLPLTGIRRTAAGLFIALGLWSLLAPR